MCGPCGPPTEFSSAHPEQYIIASSVPWHFGVFVVPTADNYSPSHLQDNKLPYDLALELGGSAELLGLLQRSGSAAWSKGYQQTVP